MVLSLIRPAEVDGVFMEGKTMKQKGFTLIEMMITMGIIAVLATIATTSYTEYVLRANRADAKIALMQLSQRQERYFTENLQYAADFDELLEGGDGAPGDYDAGDTDVWVDDSNGGYDATVAASAQDYKVTLAIPAMQLCDGSTNVAAGARAFKLTATALSTRQLKDTKCRTFCIDQTGNQTAEDTSGADESSECWGR
jgi:type IV pilus assembly protein PilE